MDDSGNINDTCMQPWDEDSRGTNPDIPEPTEVYTDPRGVFKPFVYDEEDTLGYYEKMNQASKVAGWGDEPEDWDDNGLAVNEKHLELMDDLNSRGGLLPREEALGILTSGDYGLGDEQASATFDEWHRQNDAAMNYDSTKP